MGRITVVEVDMDELAARLAESSIGIERPDGLTGKDALAELMSSGDANAKAFVKTCRRQARVCCEFVTECINKTERRRG